MSYWNKSYQKVGRIGRQKHVRANRYEIDIDELKEFDTIDEVDEYAKKVLKERGYSDKHIGLIIVSRRKDYKPYKKIKEKS